jgi:hypothetical protein
MACNREIRPPVSHDALPGCGTDLLDARLSGPRRTDIGKCTKIILSARGGRSRRGDAICGVVTTTLRCTEQTGAPQCSGSGATRSFAAMVTRSRPGPHLVHHAASMRLHGNLAEAMETRGRDRKACADANVSGYQPS